MRESGQECPYEGEDCSLTDCDERDHTLRHYGRPELGDELADLAGLFDR